MRSSPGVTGKHPAFKATKKKKKVESLKPGNSWRRWSCSSSGWQLSSLPWDGRSRTSCSGWRTDFKILTLLPRFWRSSNISRSVCPQPLGSQGILKGEVSRYCWPPVWLVWNQLYNNWQFLFLFSKQTNPNRSNRRSTVQLNLPL